MSVKWRSCLAAFLCLQLSLFGCSQKAVQTPPGRLVGVIYERSGGVVWGEDYYVSVTPEQILLIKYFVPEKNDYTEARNVPLDADAWTEIENTALALLPKLEEDRRLFGTGKTGALDGADRTDFSLVWETPEGTVTIPYQWNNSEPLCGDMTAVLQLLAQEVQ